ncbi:MAG: hypothetical protein JWO94_3158 [Verrucomicrobiaceae bacterium]|nr:hypothetical protein [Verrucomicrobiaceae bacterium]
MITSNSRTGVRIVAVFEAGKAALVLLAGMGLLSLVHKDVQAVAERFVERFHMDPAHRYPHIFIDAASKVTDARLWQLAWLALGYAMVRLVEAYGLWNHRRWAEWFAVVSGGMYIPIEIYEAIERPTWVKVCVVVINAGIVGYLAYGLRSSRVRAAQSGAAPEI